MWQWEWGGERLPAELRLSGGALGSSRPPLLPAPFHRWVRPPIHTYTLLSYPHHTGVIEDWNVPWLQNYSTIDPLLTSCILLVSHLSQFTSCILLVSLLCHSSHHAYYWFPKCVTVHIMHSTCFLTVSLFALSNGLSDQHCWSSYQGVGEVSSMLCAHSVCSVSPSLPRPSILSKPSSILKCPSVSRSVSPSPHKQTLEQMAVSAEEQEIPEGRRGWTSEETAGGRREQTSAGLWGALPDVSVSVSAPRKLLLSCSQWGSEILNTWLGNEAWILMDYFNATDTHKVISSEIFQLFYNCILSIFMNCTRKLKSDIKENLSNVTSKICLHKPARLQS